MRAGDFWTQYEWAEWSNELAHLIPEEDMGRHANPEGAQESIVLDVLRAYVAQREQLRQLAADLTDHHIGHGDYLSAGKRLVAILEAGAA